MKNWTNWETSEEEEKKDKEEEEKNKNEETNKNWKLHFDPRRGVWIGTYLK